VEDARLRDLVAEGLDWWAEASAGQVSITMSDRCYSGRSCVVVRSGPVHEGGDDHLGSTSRWEDSDGNCGARLIIAATPDDAISKVVVAHELGHALGLAHVESASELMRQSGGGPACIGSETSAEYRELFGEGLRQVCR
jgi:hypothetical protein